MLTLAMLAIAGAFACGFLLGGMFAVGAAADGFTYRERNDSQDALAAAALRAHARRGPIGRNAGT
jgi:hypothetical protein